MRMFRLLASGTAIILMLVPASATSQTSSPLPEASPWSGGRVEMPEHGFAVTLPDDWVAFDPTVDPGSQVEAVSDLLDPSVWFVDGMRLLDSVVAAGAAGTQLLSFHTTSLDHCLWAATPVMPMPAREVAEALFEVHLEQPNARYVEPPRRIDLPVGPAYHLRMSVRAEPDMVWSSASTYVLAMNEGTLVAICGTYDERPEDDWLSVVETVEFLPAE
jgi:hypothetical protein